MLALSTIAAPGQLPITFQDALNAGDVDAVLALFAPGVGMRTVAGEQIAGEEALRAEIAGSVAACGKLTSVQRHILIGAETAVLVTDWTSAHGRIRALNLLIGSQDIYKSPDIAYWQLSMSCAVSAERTRLGGVRVCRMVSVANATCVITPSSHQVEEPSPDTFRWCDVAARGRTPTDAVAASVYSSCWIWIWIWIWTSGRTLAIAASSLSRCRTVRRTCPGRKEARLTGLTSGDPVA